MSEHVKQKRDDLNPSQTSADLESGSSHEPRSRFIDNRPEALQMRSLQESINNSPRMRGEMPIVTASAGVNPPLQLRKSNPEPLTIQRMEEEEDVQMKKAPFQLKENKTGLPDNLKSGMENLTGHDLGDVKVHRNSDKPAQMQALAYAQGTDIHLGPGQEKHLPHELAHVVQQKEGRVKPTRQMKGKVNVNDDAGLEKEADAMGEKAMKAEPNNFKELNVDRFPIQQVIQRVELSDLDGVSEAEIDAAEDRFRETNFDLFFKLNYTFQGLNEMVKNDAVGINGSFLKLLHSVLDPETSEKKVSEDLSELEHVVDLPAWENTEGPIYVGAENSKKNQHGTLPPLDVEGLEVDTYYLDADNILHIDEVKDTPAAFADKAKEGKQMERHIQWLQVQSGYDKEVGYYINASGPKFDQILDPKVVNNLEKVASNQTYQGLLNVDLIEMTPADLKELMERAFAHLKKDKKTRMKKAYYTNKFSSYEETIKTLEEDE